MKTGKTRRTRGDRNYDRYERLRARLIDTVSKHTQYQSTHADLLADERYLVWDTEDCRRLTIGYRDMLREVQRCYHEGIYRSLEWRLGPAAGPIHTAGETWTEETSTLARTPGALYGAHFWKGSDRLYGEWKPTN